MVKILSLIAITAGMAATSAKGGVRLQSIVKSSTPRLDDMTTEDLEMATRRFVESNIGKIRILNNRHDDGNGSRLLNSEPSTRDERSKNVKLDSDVSNWASGKSGKDSSTAAVAGIASEEVSKS